MRQAQFNRVIVSIRTRIAAHALLLRSFRSQDGDGVIAFARAMDVACQRFNCEKPDDKPLFSADVRQFHPDCEADWEDIVEGWLDYHREMLAQLQGRSNSSEIDIALRDEFGEVDLISLYS